MPDDLINGVRISQLPAAAALNAYDVLAGVQNDETKKFPLALILNWMRANVTAEAIGAVPTTREINGHVLSQDVTLDAADVGAVPTSRTVNGKALSADITLDASDVGARADNWTPSAADVGAQPSITAVGILKGDGSGGVTAATAGTDYQTPLVAGTDYATPAEVAAAVLAAYPQPVITGNPVSFSDGAAFPFAEVAADIPYEQTGSGNPSPTNIRPFTLYTDCTAGFSGADTSNPDTVTLDWTDEAGAAAACKVDFANCTVTKTYQLIELTGEETWTRIAPSGTGYPYFRTPISDYVGINGIDYNAKCTHFITYVIASATQNIGFTVATSSGVPYVRLRITSADTESSVKAFLREQVQLGTPVRIIYTVAQASYQPIALPAAALPSGQYGVNNISADKGTLTVKYRADPTLFVTTRLPS